jgi:protein involved in polysaccharide export with SLBB domain
MTNPLHNLWIGMTLLCFVSGCGGASSGPRPALAPVADDTTLGSGDTFDVRVYGEKELSGSYRVSSEGTIDFPLVGRIEVIGKEPNEVTDLIAARLVEKQILRNPQVSIVVTDYGSKRVSVMGAVSKPGTFTMVSGLTVVHAISLAGGFTSIANRNQTIVSRKIDGKLMRFPVAVERITEGREDDFPLRAGDVVYIPERLF